MSIAWCTDENHALVDVSNDSGTRYSADPPHGYLWCFGYPHNWNRAHLFLRQTWFTYTCIDLLGQPRHPVPTPPQFLILHASDCQVFQVLPGFKVRMSGKWYRKPFEGTGESARRATAICLNACTRINMYRLSLRLHQQLLDQLQPQRPS